MDEKERAIKKEQLVTKTFWLGLEVLYIFALPAFGGAFLGSWLDGIYMTGHRITIVILCITFLFSWTIIIIKYKKITKAFKDLSK